MSQIWKTKQLDVWPHFGRRIVENAGLFEGAVVLDIGSGRGTSLLPAAERIGPEGLIIGLDNWGPFLVGVTEEIRQHGYQNAFMVKMNGGHPGLMHGCFDFVLAGFSYIYCPMKEVYSLLKPGGRISLSSWKYQEDLEWMGAIVKRILPASEYEDLSDMGVPADDGRPWVYYRDSESLLDNLLIDAGFKDVEIIEEAKSFRYRDEEEWWDQMHRVGWQDYLKKIENMGEHVMAEFKKDSFRMVGKHMDDRGLKYSRTVLLATGTK